MFTKDIFPVFESSTKSSTSGKIYRGTGSQDVLLVKLIYLSHAGQNYWTLIGWERGHFFLNHEGTFGNQERMITWCWLAKHGCIKLVSRLKRILKKNFRNASSEFDLNTVVSTWRERKSTWNKAQSFSGKAKGFFRPKMHWFAAWKKVLVATASVARSIASYRTSWPPNWKLISSFASGRLISVTATTFTLALLFADESKTLKISFVNTLSS